MTIFEHFDVVVVPFPFVDAPISKPRPALVLSRRRFNDANGHTVLAMITRATHTRWPSDHPLRDLAAAGLKHASVVRWKLFTLHNGIVLRGIGRLGEADARDCRAAMAAIFAGRS
jgi:mRNA-degrading endonuclease toxin of MazEF toxin-antitoxin module